MFTSLRLDYPLSIAGSSKEEASNRLEYPIRALGRYYASSCHGRTDFRRFGSRKGLFKCSASASLPKFASLRMIPKAALRTVKWRGDPATLHSQNSSALQTWHVFVSIRQTLQGLHTMTSSLLQGSYIGRA
eukprot:3549910-Pyramimonas_sp.AAC.1